MKKPENIRRQKFVYPERVVVLDSDGVLTNFDAHWQQCAEHLLLRAVPKLSDDYPLHSRYGLSMEECRAVWAAYHADEWHRLPLYPHAAELVYRLKNLGCHVFVVTSIDLQHRTARTASLAGLVQEDRIICVGQPGTGGYATSAAAKIAFMQGYHALAVLDDLPDNVNAIHHSGCANLSVLLNIGYQNGVETPDDGVSVIDHAMDFPILVEELLRRIGA